MNSVHFYQDQDNYVPIFYDSKLDWGILSCGDADGYGDGDGYGNGSGEVTALTLQKQSSPSDYDYTNTAAYYYMEGELQNEY